MPPRILVFSKDFNRGEPASDFAFSFAEKMRLRGINVDVVAYSTLGASTEKLLAGYMTVSNIQFLLHADTYFNWVMLMNNELKRKGRELAEANDYLLVLAIDWTSAPAASSIASFFNIPLVTAFLSTEHNRGFSYENSRPISDIEWEAAFMSKRVVAMGEDCRNSLLYDLKIPADKILSADNLFEYLRLIEEVARQA